MNGDEHGRRRFLYRAGAIVTANILAGCAGGGGSGSETAMETSTGTNTEATSTTATATTTTTTAETEMGTTSTGGSITTTGSGDSRPIVDPAPKTVDRFLTNANFYDGNMVVGEPRVAVGAGNQQLGFDPAAIKVSTGTEVIWEWASGQTKHNVVSIANVGQGQRTLDSGKPRQGKEVTYRYTFNEPGIYRYVCGVHRDQGARGAVVVAKGSVGGSGSG